MIRPVTADDAAAIAAIYAHHVAHGTATFDTVAPTADETRAKIHRILDAGAPFLVATRADRVLGYAYATRFRERAAYAHACEDSIYVDPAEVGRGVGGALLAALVDAATACGFRQMIAVIGGGEPASVALHARAGFAHAGRMRSVGRKHDRWLDTVYMQRALGAGDTTPP
jgi:phosphinothricin acetyltransferase